MKPLKLVSLLALSLIIPDASFGFGNPGHEAVVAVALQLNPQLRPRLNTILKDLPRSDQWKKLEASSLIPNNPYETEKDNPDGWVRALTNHTEKAATFADWARDYNTYKSNKYDKIHFYDLNYANVNDNRFVEEPNALTVLEPFENDLKTKTGGDRAWALVWILHIVGDLHQPLHCTARALGSSPNASDHGGNGVNYKGGTLHSFWDHLPDRSVHNDLNAYATTLVKRLNGMTKGKRKAFDTKANDLTPARWIREGRSLIVRIGYPADKKVPNDGYDDEAHRIADAQVLLAGARLAKILERDLP